MASRYVRNAGEALIDILLDPNRGPAGKTGLSGEIAHDTGRSCPPWLFDLAVRYARFQSPRRNDPGLGPLVWGGRLLDVYGYAGDVESRSQYALLWLAKHMTTRMRNLAEINRQTIQTSTGANANLIRLNAQMELICDTAATQAKAVMDQAEMEAGVMARKTLRRLGADNSIRVMLDI